MTPETWQHLQGQFEIAIELDTIGRREWIETLAKDDPELAEELEAMLEADDTSAASGSGTTALGKAVQWAAGKVASDFNPGQPPSPLTREDSADIVDLGPYRLERPLGRGGMATVYRAQRNDGTYEQCVAIKILEVVTPEMGRRFRTERQILARLDHPNIVRLLDGGETDQGLPFTVLEYVDGEPIHTFCERRRLPLAQRLDLFQAVCSAIRHAHRHGIVHRDLKPDNILVTADRVPKVLDFGIAKALEQAHLPGTMARTEPGSRLLTPTYASPEQLRGEAVTPASDLYALGLVLLALLTDERPPSAIKTTAEERLEVARRRLRRKKIEDPVAKIVEKALATSPDDRFENAQEFADALQPSSRSSLKSPRGPLVMVAAALAGAAITGWLTSTWTPNLAPVAEKLTVLAERRAELTAERARPLHDIRDAHYRLQDAITTLERGFEESQPLIGSLVQSELGRAHLAMGDLGPAKAHLQAAFAAGRQDHVTQRDLALTLGLIELGLPLVTSVNADAPSRGATHQEPPNSLQSAGEALRSSLNDREHGPGSGAYIRALLAALEGHPAAVQMHVAMTHGTAWEAPAHLLEAHVFRGNPQVAAKALKATIHIAPSDFRGYWGLCLLALARLDGESAAKDSANTQQQLSNQNEGAEACRQAMVVRPDSSEAQTALNRLRDSGPIIEPEARAQP